MQACCTSCFKCIASHVVTLLQVLLLDLENQIFNLMVKAVTFYGGGFGVEFWIFLLLIYVGGTILVKCIQLLIALSECQSFKIDLVNGTKQLQKV